jgi:hypothetical protein
MVLTANPTPTPAPAGSYPVRPPHAWRGGAVWRQIQNRVQQHKNYPATY